MINSVTKDKTVLAILFFAVVVSGCTGGGGEEQASNTASISVQEFSAFPNPTPANQSTRIRMTLKNVGGSDAEQVSARLYNPPFGDYGQSKTWRTERSNQVMNKSYRTLWFRGGLAKAGEQTPAIPKTKFQNFRSPALEQGRNIGYTFNSYIAFDYNTTANTEIQVVGGDKYREMGSPRNTATLDQSAGPIKMEIRTPTPIVVYEGSDSTLTKDLCIIARNKGNGVPFDSTAVDFNEGDGGWNISEIQEHKNQLRVGVDAAGSVEFEGQSGEVKKDMEILGGKAVKCFEMSISGVTGTIQRTIPVDVNAYYGYRKSSRTTVNVEGRR